MKPEDNPAVSPIQTEDASWTAYSPVYHETFHSISGAQEECEIIFWQGSQIAEKWQAFAQASAFKMLEVGFGLGLNWQTLQKHWQAQASQDLVPSLVQYHALEKDTALIKATAQQLNLSLTWVAQDDGNDDGHDLGHWFFAQTMGHKTLQLLIWPGDARQVLPKIAPHLTPCQAIWQDAFSPQHNLELWTWQWFKELAQICDPTAIVATYSSATPVRLAMQKAGFNVAARPASKRKKSSTIAALSGIQDAALAQKLATSPLKPYDDQLLQ